MDLIGDARFVLLGEASHGTSEYYTWRARITRRLITEKQFSFLCVEGDWPDCYRVNRFVKGLADSDAAAHDAVHAFDRWPTWMWANWEIVALAQWLRAHNQELDPDKRVGFYGLDVYSLRDSMTQVLKYLERVDGRSVQAALRAFKCFEPYAADAVEYARSTLWTPAGCTDEVLALLTEMRSFPRETSAQDPESHFVAEQNAIVVRNAERYYRTMIRGGPESWNIRDRHMAETLDRLMKFHGPESKAIVWEHNTHIGDARATDMAGAGMVNVGQLVRESHASEGVALVGFGSYEGTVVAAYEWGAPMQRLRVPPAREGSWEWAMRAAWESDQLALLRGALESLRERRGHRAIGVVYDPDYERFGNYVPTALADRYDAFLYVDRTQALHPLHIPPHDQGEPPNTYPWGI
jgi:erythromycin esterase-like protein